MTDTILEIQGAVTARLKSSAGVSALVVGRVYDPVPLNAARPYISFGPSDALSDDADCIDTDEISFQIDCWSESPGFVQVRRISDAVRRALNDEFSINNNALVLFEHRKTRSFS